MKALFFLFALLLPTLTLADSLTAPPFQEALNEALNKKFTYVGHWLKFGFNSIDSCLWKSSDMLVIKNYCYPEKKYPARGIEIWSKKYGIIYIFQEKTPSGIVMKRISISQFPEMVQGIFPENFEMIDFQTMNSIDEKLYYRWNPACWSTNYNPYIKDKQASCVKTDISLYSSWAEETQQLVLSSGAWDQVFAQLSDVLKDSEL